jgi:hypothetical protein
MASGAQNMKTGLDALVLPKMSLEEQNMKLGPDKLGTAEKESERAEHENET